jgi:hypothetical protein
LISWLLEASMPRTGRRKSAEEMAEILRVQAELGQTNAECAIAAGLSVDTVKRWRARLRHRPKNLQDLVEWTSPPQALPSELAIELPENVRLILSGSWDVVKIASLVRELRSL